MKIYVKNTIYGLMPLYPSDYEEKKKLPIGWEGVAEIKRERNYEFHKKFFALLNMFFDNQPEENEIKNFNTFRKIKTMKAGFYESVITDKGITYLPISISFSSMDETEFKDLYSKMLDVVIRDLKITEEMYNSMIKDYL
jgi:hypothetical protein